MNAASDAHYGHCEALLRERDRDLWLSCLFAPQPARKHVHAVYAFAFEIAEVRSRVSQPLLGEMRLRWWTDAIEIAGGDAGEGARAHPVADALLDTIARYDLPRDEIIALADAHIVDLYDDPLPTLTALEDYCRATVVAPIRWSARILGADLTAPAARAFDDAGIALGLTRILRALPQNAGGQSFLPMDLLLRHGVSPESIRAREDSPGLRGAIKELSEFTLARYAKARHAAAALKNGREALLPAATTPLYLEQIAGATNPFLSVAEPAPLRRQWRIWRASRGAGL